MLKLLVKNAWILRHSVRGALAVDGKLVALVGLAKTRGLGFMLNAAAMLAIGLEAP